MSNRRGFLKQLFIGGAGFAGLSAIPSEAFAQKEIIKLTILHTNDMHSHIEPFPKNDPKFGGLGGIARRATVINKIRQQEEHVLLLDAGDIFQGTPYFNKFGGEPELKLMSQMGYDAATIGNHDFDNGLNELEKMLPFAKFPFICSNYDFTDTPMEGKTIPYKIINKGGIAIGIFGLGVELDGLVEKRLYGNTKFLDPIETAARMAFKLKKEMNCGIVICLSHLGFKYSSNKISDVALAQRSKNIDIIIGGHTHTFLDAPQSFNNSDNKEVIVGQAGWAGLRLGRIDCFYERKKAKKTILGSSMILNEEILNA